MSIRTKLLLVMAGLLVVSTALSLILHVREGQRVRDDVEAIVHGIVDRIVQETRPGGLLDRAGPGTGATVTEVESIRHRLAFEDRMVSFRIEKRVDVLVPGDRPPGLLQETGSEGVVSPYDPIPAENLEAELHETFRDPIVAAQDESLPRQLLIAGSVLLVGLGMVGILSRRLTEPTRELTEKMRMVAAGDLLVKVRPTTRDEVGQMAVAFNSMVDRLREKRELEQKMFRAEQLSAIGNLAAGVAHDIRNPLNTIGLTLAHVGERYAPADAAENRSFRRHMDDVKRELERLNELVRSFLALARPDRGERVPCDLRAIVEECLRLFRKEAESKGVTVRTELEDVDPIVANPQQIRGALTNVVVNALGAMDAAGTETGGTGATGGMAVSLFTRPAGPGSAPPREVVLRVADNGPGIAEKDLEKVFLPYFTTREDGTGLGLPIARGGVEANGGRMEIRSRPEKGTEVDIVLPLEPDAGAPAAPVPGPVREGGAP